jgi:hypothetical protein
MLSSCGDRIPGLHAAGGTGVFKMEFRFRFDPLKTMQAIAVLMRRERLPQMNYMRLIKILYIAERECLKETGRPITGSRIVATERGPIMEEVHDLVLGRYFRAPEFSRCFEKVHYDLVMKDDPGIGELSEFEIARLQEVAERHADDDEWEMVRHCHTLPEWQKNDPGDSSRPIPLVDILEAVGVGEYAEEIIKDALEQQSAQEAFEECRRGTIRKRVPVDASGA